MAEFGLRTGVWTGSLGLGLGGGVAVLSAAVENVGLIRLGWTSIFAGVALAIWGVTWNGEHWWRSLTRRTLSGREQLFASVYMTPHEVTAYIAEESEWGRQVSAYEAHDPGMTAHWGAPVTEKKNPWLAAWTEFPRQAQRPDSAIKVFGTPQFSASPELIRQEFWLTNAPSLESCLEAGKPSQTAPTVLVHGSPEVYENLKIERAGVTRTWPKRKRSSQKATRT